MSLCECGCGRDAGFYRGSGNGHKDGEPARFVRGHHSARLRKHEALEETPDGCLLWMGSTSDGSNGDGYGVTSIAGRKKVYYHRYVYEQKYGPIPLGMQIHHKCNNRRCANVEHLQLVTNAENQRARAKLTQEKADEIRALYAQGNTTYTKLAAQFGVTFGRISQIVTGKAWQTEETHKAFPDVKTLHQEYKRSPLEDRVRALEEKVESLLNTARIEPMPNKAKHVTNTESQQGVLFEIEPHVQFKVDPKWQEEWRGMPDYSTRQSRPFKLLRVLIDDQIIRVRFAEAEDWRRFVARCGCAPEETEIHFASLQRLAGVVEQKITTNTASIWYPFRPHVTGHHTGHVWISDELINPRFPVYIVSKGRWQSRLTSRALERMQCPYYIVVEEQERERYARVIDPAKILVLPQRYLNDYNTCDTLSGKSKGPGAARNFCWDHSTALGATWHWVMDDNLHAFHRLHENHKHETETATTLRAAEDFVLRYDNIAIAGPNYYSNCKLSESYPPYYLNTRIYSCLLIRNDIPYRWRARYNEDTDLCLRVLKDGWVTVLFNAFLCGKVTTQRMTGGNTRDFYDNEGTLPKSEMLAALHPDVAKVIMRFNRWHHYVDYSHFNLPLRRNGTTIDTQPYQMRLVRR